MYTWGSMDKDLGFGIFVLVWLVGIMIAVDHSILWATVRGILGWIWVAYYYFMT